MFFCTNDNHIISDIILFCFWHSSKFLCRRSATDLLMAAGPGVMATQEPGCIYGSDPVLNGADQGFRHVQLGQR